MSIRLASCCNRGSIPASDQPQLVYILIEISPDPAAAPACLPVYPLVVLDRSGQAMQDSLPAIRQALKDLVDLLGPADHFCILSLGGEVLLPPQAVDRRTSLKRIIDGIHCVEEKRSAGALSLALEHARLEQAAGCVPRLILVLGGAIEAEESDAFLAAGDQAASQQVSIAGIGVGYDWDEQLLLKIAARSTPVLPDWLAGTAYFVPSSEEIGETASDLFRWLCIFASQTQISARLVRGVEIRQVWQVLPLIKNWNAVSIRNQMVTIPLGDLNRGGAAFLIEAVLPPRAPGPARIAQIEATCTLRDSSLVRVEADLVVDFSIESGATNPLDSYVMDFVENAQAHYLNCQAMSDMEAGNPRAAAQKFRQAAAILVSQNRIDLADRIRGEADYNLRQYGKISSEARKLILLTGRKLPKLKNLDG